MRQVTLTVPELLLVVWTRAALGVGVGLLAGDGMSRDARRATGRALAIVGMLTTFPLAAIVLDQLRRPRRVAAAPQEAFAEPRAADREPVGLEAVRS